MLKLEAAMGYLVLGTPSTRALWPNTGTRWRSWRWKILAKSVFSPRVRAILYANGVGSVELENNRFFLEGTSYEETSELVASFLDILGYIGHIGVASAKFWSEFWSRRAEFGKGHTLSTAKYKRALDFGFGLGHRGRGRKG